ncbi:MAG: PIN domain-containing protein [Halobaculum sp.]
MIVDTQYLGALADGDDAAREKARELDDSDVPTRVPTAVVWEAYTGVGQVATPAKAGRIRENSERLVSGRPTVDLTPHIARRVGQLRGTHQCSDTLPNLDGVDSLVAAHGLVRDEPVASNDTDFERVDGLNVVTY